MDKTTKDLLIKDKMIKKFSAYGFLRNLTFFKPYLLIFLMNKNIDLFQIGILYSVKELTVYLFEVPSGMIADYFGRKKELYLCFAFYIMSFICFYNVNNFSLAVIAMLLFGLGDAFRSGTHKAIILSYLDKIDMKSHKTFVYGRTRSFSLLGGALNSLIAILIVLYSPSYNYIFLCSIIPYILEFLLISTYPSYLDKADHQKLSKTKGSFTKEIKLMFQSNNLRNIILSQSFFELGIKTSKNLIQPILKTILISTSFITLFALSISDYTKITIGLCYFMIKITSSYCTRNIYIIKNKFKSKTLEKAYFYSLGFSLITIAISIHFSSSILCIIMFFVINILGDSRKPIFLEVIDSETNKSLRATTLSIQSQTTAILSVIVAPILGYIANTIGLKYALAILGLTIITIKYLAERHKNN